MRNLPVLIAVPLVVGFGVVEGAWQGRFTGSSGAAAAARELEKIPLTVGEWRGYAEELDADQVAIAQLSGYVLRRYVRADTGDTISLLVVCGAPGPVSVHTPESCFPGAGYRAVGQASQTAITPADSSEGAPFRQARFRNDEAAGQTLLAYWSWNARGEWQTPDYPRFRFAGLPALFKMYIVQDVTGLDETSGDVLADFTRRLLAELRNNRFGTLP